MGLNSEAKDHLQLFDLQSALHFAHITIQKLQYAEIDQRQFFYKLALCQINQEICTIKALNAGSKKLGTYLAFVLNMVTGINI